MLANFSLQFILDRGTNLSKVKHKIKYFAKTLVRKVEIGTTTAKIKENTEIHTKKIVLKIEEKSEIELNKQLFGEERSAKRK